MKLSDIRIKMTFEEARKHEQYCQIPPYLLEIIYLYVQEGRQPGHFLSAVLCNDLFEAVGRADSDALKALGLIVIFIHNRVPSCAYKIRHVPGPKAVNRWLKWHSDKTVEIDTSAE